MWTLRNAVLVAAVACFAIGCVGEPIGEDNTSIGIEALSAAEAFELFEREGLTCEVKGAMLSFGEQGVIDFSTFVQENLEAEEAGLLFDMEEVGCDCDTEISALANSGIVRQAVVGDGEGESIEETYLGGGNTPSSIFYDSSYSDWMCNSGSPEWPADHVVQVNVYGSYNNRSGLRVYGTTYCGKCAIPGALSSLVYSDNDIRSCVGYLRALGCCSGILYTSDFRYGLL